VGQHHRADRRRDQQRAGDLEREHVAGEQDVGEALDVAAAVGLLETHGAAERDLAERDDEHDAEQQPAGDGQGALTPDRLDHGVGGVDADDHHHEEEQHQDRAGVDDDLHGEEERRLEHGVQHREADHHDREQQGGVHRLAHEQHRERGQHHDRGQHHERWAHEPAPSAVLRALACSPR
jgi:hypothetical protein